MCAVMSAGRFDHTKGGHIYMKQLRVACEFPSGSTILLLSAGALFRWAAYGQQSAQSLLAQSGGAARKREIDGEDGVRAAWALGLLSKADDLDADRQEVFGEAERSVAGEAGHEVR
ncbi:hypothetical protein MSAN_01692200 [Mycena sanguinolenta]|uniref:Uncharacterized protein n=1 Tax=Mycena sanguinolenta TaxID=230812 RepID=A0A8H6Y0K8_9AGAR|nr:hypothetical protein MSAN_01692200 [Mycena sanguinolenta]